MALGGALSAARSSIRDKGPVADKAVRAVADRTGTPKGSEENSSAGLNHFCNCYLFVMVRHDTASNFIRILLAL
jgi:hypothetical protein